MDIEKTDGKLIESDGNNPFLIDDPLYCWVVMEEKVNLYGVYIKDGSVTGTRNYICTIEKGGVLFGFKGDEHFGFLAVGQSGTKVSKIKISDLKDKLPFYMDRWIDDISKALSSVVKRVRVIKTDEETDITAGETILSSGPVMWLRNLKGSFIFLGRDDFSPVKEDSFFPVSKNLWWISEQNGKIKSFTTDKYIAEDSELRYFGQFQQNLLEFIKIRIVEGYIDEKESLEKKELTDISVFSEAVSGLASTMEGSKTVFLSKTGEDILFRTCQLIGKHGGINFQRPPGNNKKINDPFTEIARASKIRHRRVSLNKNWWKEDKGPILGFLKEDNQPVALIPASFTSYDMMDCFKNLKIRITEETVSNLLDYGYMFYPSFPPVSLSLWNILAFGLKYCKSDILNFLFISVLVGLLGMVVPVITGIIFNDIIPGGEKQEILILSLSLLVTSLSVAIFQILQSISLIRIEGRMNGVIQAAIWDRIMLLPCSFFRNYSSGDLASRSLGFDAICRELFTGLTLPSLLSFIYVIFSFPLLFYYSKDLAVISSIFAIIIFIVIIFTGYMQLSSFRQLYTLQGYISGFVFQLINGIAKLKVAGAEARAFAQWAEKFSLQKRLAFKIQIIKNFYGTFNSIILLVSSLVIFLFIAKDIFKGTGAISISSGDFLAFNAAFSGFMMSVIQLGMTISSLTIVVPTVERLKPLIETLPEVDNKKSDPGEISGEIEVSHVSFRYKKRETSY